MFAAAAALWAMMAVGILHLGWGGASLGILAGNGAMAVMCLASHNKSVSLSRELERLGKAYEAWDIGLILDLPAVIYSRDRETGGHVRRSGDVVGILTAAMSADGSFGVTAEFCRMVTVAAPLHDLGKLALPDSILRKPGRLTAEEYKTVKTHCTISAELIRCLFSGRDNKPLLTIAENMALYHHERVDGTGYPMGLKGGEIPLEARIMALADVCDALLSQRCYKEAIPFNEAFETLKSAMGTQFDPALEQCLAASRTAIERYYGAI